MLIDKHVVFGLFEGNQTRCVRAFIPSDGVYEGEENFTIIMTPPALVNTETQQMLVHINDSDSKYYKLHHGCNISVHSYVFWTT